MKPASASAANEGDAIGHRQVDLGDLRLRQSKGEFKLFCVEAKTRLVLSELRVAIPGRASSTRLESESDLSPWDFTAPTTAGDTGTCEIHKVLAVHSSVCLGSKSMSASLKVLRYRSNRFLVDAQIISNNSANYAFIKKLALKQAKSLLYCYRTYSPLSAAAMRWHLPWKSSRGKSRHRPRSE